MVEDYLAAWSANIIGRTPLRLRVPVWANEEYRRRTTDENYAGITVIAEPSDVFAVSIELRPSVLQQMHGPPQSTVVNMAAVSDEGETFLGEVIFGILDILVTADRYPLLGLRLRLVAASIHPAQSTPSAFRMVGRQVGRRIVVEHIQAR